jgi:hypothetical protein
MAITTSQQRPERQQSAEVQEPLVQAGLVPTLPRALRAAGPAAVPSVVTVRGRERTAAEVVGELLGALAGEPRVVECDLTDLAEEGWATGEVFAPVGHYLRHWPGTTLLMRVPDPVVRSSLTSLTDADRMIIDAGSEDAALRAHRLLPRVQRRALSLPSAPTAPKMARDFAARTLRHWRLPGLREPVSQVLTEFVTYAVISGGTDVVVSLSRIDTRVRIATTSPAATTSASVSDLSELPLTGPAQRLVQALTQACGVIGGRPGTTMWAVFDAWPGPHGDQGQHAGYEQAEPRHRGPAGPDALVDLQGRPGGRHRRDNGLPKPQHQH